MGQEVEVRPGIVTKDSEGRAQCIPIYSRIVSLKAESNDLQYAVPGGLIGVGTTVRARGLQAETLALCPSRIRVPCVIWLAIRPVRARADASYAGRQEMLLGSQRCGSSGRAERGMSLRAHPTSAAPSQVDPTLTRADRLVGQVLGQVGELPDVYSELEINFFLLRRLLGVRTSVRFIRSCGAALPWSGF